MFLSLSSTTASINDQDHFTDLADLIAESADSDMSVIESSDCVTGMSEHMAFETMEGAMTQNPWSSCMEENASELFGGL